MFSFEIEYLKKHLRWFLIYTNSISTRSFLMDSIINPTNIHNYYFHRKNIKNNKKIRNEYLNITNCIVHFVF